MKEIFKIIKKYILGILAVVVLLVIQAQCDLKLPEYTSDIINVGIQQKGVSSNVPEILSTRSMEALTAIMQSDELKDNYTYVEKGNKEYIDTYEILASEDIYILKDINDEKRQELEDKILKAETFCYILSQSKELKELGFSVNASVINYYTGLSEDNPIKKMFKSLEDMDQSMLKQYAINFVISEYTNLHLDLESMQMHYLFKVGIKMLLFSLFIMAIIILTTYISGKVASKIAYDMRDKVVETVMSYSNSEFNSFSTSSLITRTTNDINQIQIVITILLRMILYAPIIGIGALTKVAGIDMVWVIGIAIAAMLILIIVLLLFALPKFKIVQKLIDRINLTVRETLNGLPVIRAFANEDFEKKKFAKANDDLMKVNLFTQRLMAAMNPCMMFIMNGICVLIMWVGASKVDLGVMQVGTLTALINYTVQIIIAFLMLSMISIIGPRSMISLKRVGEVLSKKPLICNKKHPRHITKDDNYAIEFKNVSFQYPDGDELVLHDLSFKVKEGETLAIIGSTGSGKSSIVNLIPRFFDVTKGSIKINNIDIRDLDIHDLRELIGIVPQKGLLFSGTIASNIKFANKNINDKEMKLAASIACADEFIEEKEGQYDSEISQGGTNVSGGQRQRLAIARAVAKDPNIYIFDDSFSVLDYKTDATIRKNLAKHCSKATKIIVAQRVGTIMHADQIIVLDQGEVVGIGTHEYLYKNCKVYKDIALSQLKEEELV